MKLMKLTQIAALWLLGAGCGQGGEEQRPPVTGQAYVQAYEEGVGAGGRIALVQDATGDVHATRATGVDGMTSAPVAPGDMVTIANVGSARFELTTYLGVRAHDILTIGEPEAEDGATDLGAVPVALSGRVAGAARHEVGLGLGYTPHTGGTQALHLTDQDHAAGGRFQVLGLARDARGVPIAFAVADSTVRAVGQGLTLPAWRTDWDEVVFALDGLRPGAVVEARVDVLQGRSARLPMDPVAPPDGSRFAVKLPRGLGQELAFELEIEEADTEASRLYARREPLRHEVALTGDAFLPAITDVTVTPSSDPARPLISWTVDGDPARADFVMLRVTWNDDAHVWTVVAPATGPRSLRLPALPDDLAIWRPTTDLRVSIGLIELSTLDGYASVLRRGVEELTDLASGATLRTSQLGDLGL